jgi:hypothetical protein
MSYYTLGGAQRRGSGLGQDSIMGALGQVARRSIRRVTFRSAVSPEIELDPNQEGPRSSGQGGGGEAFLRFAKPAWYLDIGGSVVKLAPWGEPTTNYFPLLAGAAVVVGALGVGLAIRGLRRR